MDLGNLTMDYSDYLTTAKTGTDTRTQNAVDRIGKDSTDEELMDACRQFESYLLEQVFKEMQKTVSFNDEEDDNSALSLTGNSNALQDYFMEQAVADIAETSTRKEGLGIAQMLYESMKRNAGLTE